MPTNLIQWIHVELENPPAWEAFGLRATVRVDVGTRFETTSVRETLEPHEAPAQLRALFERVERELLKVLQKDETSESAVVD